MRTLALAVMLLCSGCGFLVTDLVPAVETIPRPRPVCPPGVDPAAVTWCRVVQP